MAAPPAVSGAQQQPPPANAELEALFWQSIMNSTNPAEFEAYLAQFPNGVFLALAEARLSALPGSASATSANSEAAGSRVSGAPDAGSRPAAGVDARSRSGAVFRPDLTCAGQPPDTACWMEVSGRPGCYLWNPFPVPDSTATWTGQCTGGLAQGTGTTMWAWVGGRQAATGRLADGVPIGHWIIRQDDGTVGEGPYVDGMPHGPWVYRWANGGVSDIQFVNGEEVSRRRRAPAPEPIR